METLMNPIFWYRYEDVRHANIDEWGDVGDTYTEVYLREYQLLKVTPKGVWLDRYGTRRFVLRDARKRFACPTIEEAQKSFLARKNAQIRIYQERIDNARRAIARLPRVRAAA